MSIKYHQWGTGNEYGANFELTDNWDSNADYGNEYVSVYFRIDTPLYDDCICDFKSDEDSEKWHAETSELIKSFGVMDGSIYDITRSKEKCAYLYAHPQNISGVIRKNDVKRIAEAISKMELSSIWSVDLYETVYVISDNEYEEYLNGRRDEIRKVLFEESATTRTTKYYNIFDVARSLADKFRLNRLGINDGKNYGSGQTIDYILNVADEMIEEGLLKSFEQNGEKYIRSLNKTEQKQMKVKFA